MEATAVEPDTGAIDASKSTMTAEGTGTPSVAEVLTNKAFMCLFSAQFIENIGRAVSGLALEFLIYGLTKSPALMGLLSIIWLSPFVVIAPFAGVYTDRFDQRKIMFLSNILSCVASVGFVVIYLLSDLLTQHIIITEVLPTGQIVETHIYNPIHVLWPLFILCFLNSAAAAFFFPARSAYTRLIVKKRNLLIANSIGSTVFQVATIVGYVLAGFLASISYLVSFIFDATTFAVSGILIGLLFIIGKTPPKVEHEKSQNLKDEAKQVVADLKIGYRTIREFPKISYMLMLFAAATFTFAAVNVLFIVILQGEMGLNSTWYGVLQALMGASGIVTALVMMSLGKIRRKVLVMNVAIALAAIAMGCFAVVRNKWLMGGILFSFGIIIVSINIPASTLIQETVPYKKQGRVFGAQQVVQGISQLIGMGIVALIAEFVLPMYVLLTSTGLLVLIAIFGFIYSGRKGLMGSDYYEEGEEEEEKSTKELTMDADDPNLTLEPEKQKVISYGGSK